MNNMHYVSHFGPKHKRIVNAKSNSQKKSIIFHSNHAFRWTELTVLRSF